MGVFQRTAGGVWHMEFIFQGKRVRRSTGMRSKAEALKVEHRTREEMEYYVNATPSQKAVSITIEEAIERAMKEHFANLANGLKDYNSRAQWWAEELNGLTLAGVNEEVIGKARRKLVQVKNSPATINRYLAFLSKVLHLAGEEWLCLPRVPKIKLEQEVEGRLFVFSVEQEDMILEHLEHNEHPFFPDLKDYFSVLIDTGLRHKEATTLSYAHNVDLKNGALHLNADITKRHIARTIPLTDRSWLILRERKLTNSEKPFAFSRDWASKVFKKVLVEVGIEDSEAVLYCARHTFITRLLENGVDIYKVMKLAGHRNIKTTERYAHLTVNSFRDAISTLDRQPPAQRGKVLKFG